MTLTPTRARSADSVAVSQRGVSATTKTTATRATTRSANIARLAYFRCDSSREKATGNGRNAVVLTLSDAPQRVVYLGRHPECQPMTVSVLVRSVLRMQKPPPLLSEQGDFLA